MGVCFSMERWDILSAAHQNPLKDESKSCQASAAKDGTAGPERRTESSDCYGPVSGQLIATMKEVCRQAFQAQPQRLMAAMYTCEIIATADVLGEETLGQTQQDLKVLELTIFVACPNVLLRFCPMCF